VYLNTLVTAKPIELEIHFMTWDHTKEGICLSNKCFVAYNLTDIRNTLCQVGRLPVDVFYLSNHLLSYGTLLSYAQLRDFDYFIESYLDDQLESNIDSQPYLILELPRIKIFLRLLISFCRLLKSYIEAFDAGLITISGNNTINYDPDTLALLSNKLVDLKNDCSLIYQLL
jgi:hypothetical protein